MGAVRERLLAQLRTWPKTLLGVGVVSRLTVEATVELANEHYVDLMLIPSRRQVDTDALGAGYVEGWSADRFAEFVRARDTGGRVLLCRDHGGPWQNARELAGALSESDAMASAMRSYDEDIEAGFSVLHLDTSVSPDGEPPGDVALERLFTLYRHCTDTARRLGREIAFEIGTEEQDAVTHGLDDLSDMLERVQRFCREQDVEPPLFVVAQTGTKVLETRNVGSFGSPYRIRGEMPSEIHVPQLVDRLRSFDVLLKQHNTDYLSRETLRSLPAYGIAAANVAPEFGVTETRALLHVLEANGLLDLRDRFIELALASRKWEKWMLAQTRADDRDRAVIAGHYVFSTPEFAVIRHDADARLATRGVDLEGHLKSRVKDAIRRYLECFRLTGVP
ncbi:hypothetical protein [Thalassobaculum sp.]|uniref:hypothetical protein n=1 Tax=Thalassobaculum sp. TaxID=2022740 RepID=UPI0032EB1957